MLLIFKTYITTIYTNFDGKNIKRNNNFYNQSSYCLAHKVMETQVYIALLDDLKTHEKIVYVFYLKNVLIIIFENMKIWNINFRMVNYKLNIKKY